DSTTRSKCPTVRWTVSQAKSWREIVIIRTHQRPADKLISRLDWNTVVEVERNALIDIPGAGPREDRRLGPAQQTIRAHTGVEHLNIKNTPVFVMPGGVVFVAQAQIHGHLGCDLPVVLEVDVGVGGPKQCVRQAEAAFRLCRLP